MLYRHRTVSTPRGDLDTPVLFPVRNIGKRSTDNTPEYAYSIPDLQTAMVNSLAIRERDPQWERILAGSSLREELGVPDSTIVFADSGGFGFQSEVEGTTPKKTLQTQRRIDADIYGTVDVPLKKNNALTQNQELAHRNIDRALVANDAHEGDALLFASIHGYDSDTIRSGISYLDKHGDFDGYALGSLVPISKEYTKVIRLILAARETTDKHLHVYGLGGLVYTPLLLYLGVDSFDSTSFIRSAGNRRYLIPGFRGEILQNIANMKYLPCACPACAPNTLEEIRESRDLLVRHNLWALAVEIRRFRYIVETNRDVEAYLDLRFRGNTVTHRAFKNAQQQVRRLS